MVAHSGNDGHSLIGIRSGPMVVSDLLLPGGTTDSDLNAGTEDRNADRFPWQGLVQVTADPVTGEGQIVDLSIGGCSIEGGLSVQVGDYLQLRLFLPDKRPAISVTMAAVRWVSDLQFGVEFIGMEEDAWIHLKNFVAEQSTRQGV